jgi:hypothetical protein
MKNVKYGNPGDVTGFPEQQFNPLSPRGSASRRRTSAIKHPCLMDDALLLLIFNRFTAPLVSQVRDHRIRITCQSTSNF